MSETTKRATNYFNRIISGETKASYTFARLTTSRPFNCTTFVPFCNHPSLPRSHFPRTLLSVPSNAILLLPLYPSTRPIKILRFVFRARAYCGWLLITFNLLYRFSTAPPLLLSSFLFLLRVLSTGRACGFSHIGFLLHPYLFYHSSAYARRSLPSGGILL